MNRIGRLEKFGLEKLSATFRENVVFTTIPSLKELIFCNWSHNDIIIKAIALSFPNLRQRLSLNSVSFRTYSICHLY